jgi:rod shape-determining protein MreD
MLARHWRDRAAFAVPACVTVFSTLLALSPAPFDSVSFYPHSYVLCIAVFTLHAPMLLPMAFVFVAGLVADIVYATPFGLHGLCGILLQYAILKMREPFISAPFLFIWGGMALLISAVLCLMWALTLFVTQTSAPLSSISWLWGASVALYPVWHSIGVRILRCLPHR